ncbi:hypothetical protein NEUTE1DRAFT_111927 [Neurospora tetrasperma FGSC 2508]|uniref:Uncharacterized protein n=1 Tax=Neurospora tetrasperma (strain FGSC 2508 / ATCC MYA-4615 / P0657) TaxID=510951 RepID=F8MTP8_NEUT8|nr:uncharacterized protein NEUTE1DRAFT_111927 [Neurospora tetrasperma FGSC 2508]EGO55380.1 hypothetical protein NEUTE1DRAFT_111927 [Neurospora tetrasperma FGSC 2508]EGZ69394.1 hypothetical protein NEUTE2DRAFT_140978 [Neurospora tetrasperma FGSC 2509]
MGRNKGYYFISNFEKEVEEFTDKLLKIFINGSLVNNKTRKYLYLEKYGAVEDEKEAAIKKSAFKVPSYEVTKPIDIETIFSKLKNIGKKFFSIFNIDLRGIHAVHPVLKRLPTADQPVHPIRSTFEYSQCLTTRVFIREND